jgi:hypothetical protein
VSVGGSIEGHVFVSTADQLGSVAGSTPLADVAVQLLDESGHVLETVRTNSAGRYEFVDLRNGFFSIREVQPTGFAEGIARAGNGGGSVLGRNLIADVQVHSGQQFAGYDFWELPFTPTPSDGGPSPGLRPVFPLSAVSANRQGNAFGAVGRITAPSTGALTSGQHLATTAAPANLLLALPPAPPIAQPVAARSARRWSTDGIESQPIEERLPSVELTSPLREFDRRESPDANAGSVIVDSSDDARLLAYRNESPESEARDLYFEGLPEETERPARPPAATNMIGRAHMPVAFQTGKSAHPTEN